MARLMSDLKMPDKEQDRRDMETALDWYLVTHNKTGSYELYRRLVSRGTFKRGASIRSTANSWFAQPEMQKYIEERTAELIAYYAIEPAKAAEAGAVKQNMTPDQIRQKNYDDLEALKRDTDDPAVKANIIKQQTDLMNAKLQNNVETYASDALIHFYLPYDVCDKCPHHDKK